MDPQRPGALPGGDPGPIRQGSSEVRGSRLRHARAGAGPPTLLIHGWPATWRLWQEVAPILAAGGFSAVAPDLPGLGESAAPDDGDYRKAATADRLHGLMLALGHRRFSVVGHDIGCMVAYALAAAHPDAVERLVLSEAWLPGFGLEEGMDVARGGLWHFGFHMQAAVAEALTRGRERYYLDAVAFEGMPAAYADLFARDYERPGRMRAGFEHYATLLRDAEEFRALAGRGPLRMPVLALGGDGSMPIDRLAEGARRVARDVRVAAVPGGHWFPLEHPREAAGAILAFLAGG